MSSLLPAFLAPLPLTSPHPTSRSFHPSITRRPVRPTLRHRIICVAHEEATQPPPHVPHVPDTTPSSSPPSPPLSLEQRKERARKARMEAERLELMAAKARLEFERAELAAERKRLELDKVKNLKEVDDHRNSTAAKDQEQRNPYESNPTVDRKSPTIVGPQVLPPSLTELLSAEFPRVAETDIQIIREKLCGIGTFFVTEVDRSPFDERVVFRGNMRMPADKLLPEFNRMANDVGIADRVRFFLLLDPKVGDDAKEKGPVLVVLPRDAKPNQSGSLSALLSVIVGLCACATTFSYGIGIFGLTPEVITQIAKGSVEDAIFTLPISVGAILVALLHDAGHRVAALWRDVKLGLPYFIPSLQIGTYGTITPLESYPKFRKDLFDVAVAGPLVGTTCSIAALVAGLMFTSSGEIADWFPQVPSALFHASILVGSLADTILPPGMREQATIAVHPLTVVGYTGLLSNALNLMPIGRLDGGRIVQALYGRQIAGRATAVTLLVQGFSSLLGNSPLLLFWGLVCVFLQRESDYPCLNEVIEPDSTRNTLGIGVLCVMLLVLIPFPEQVGDILGQF